VKYFETSGLWYPSDDPDNAVGGTLKFNKKGLRLVLLGSLRQGWSPQPERYPVIHGVVGDSPYGTFVTLIDSFRIAQKFNMVGATSEVVMSHLAMVGNFHLPENPLNFEKIDLDYSHLTDWIGTSGIEITQEFIDEKLIYTAAYKSPKNTQFPYGESTITLRYQFSSSRSAHRISLTEGTRLTIQPIGTLTSETLFYEHIRTLQNLISFATDRANGEEEIAYKGEEKNQQITPKLNMIYDAIYRLKSKKKQLHSTEMLFTFADTQAAGFNVFQNWLAFTNKHSSFCKLYFGHIYAIPKYLDDRLKNIMVAFTLLCSTLEQESRRTELFLETMKAAIRTHFSEDEREFLGHLVPTWSEVEMPTCLHQYLEMNSDLMEPLIGDYHAFVQAVSDTLGFVDRRQQRDRPPLNGNNLLFAIEKINILIKILVLKELGFGYSTVKTLIKKNISVNHIN